jgi:phosphatidate phosphatase PAH1
MKYQAFITNCKWLLGISVVGLSSCRGGGQGIDDLKPFVFTDSSTEQCPQCPNPESLPFDAPKSGFLSADNEQTATDYTESKSENQDTFVTDTTAQTVLGRMSLGQALKTYGLAGEKVSLWNRNETGWLKLGEQTTDENGYYSFGLTGELAFGAGSHQLFAVLEANSTCATHGVFVWPQGTQVIVTDIDGTLTLNDAEFLRQIGEPDYVPQQNQSADKLMNEWSSKGYKIIYLTARPHLFRVPTRTWLAQFGFPFGPVITADTLVFDESARTYKRDNIAKIGKEYGWKIVAQYGNATSDIQAYEDAQLSKSTTFIVGEKAGEAATVAIPNQDFSQHIANYVKSQPDAQQPSELPSTACVP